MQQVSKRVPGDAASWRLARQQHSELLLCPYCLLRLALLTSALDNLQAEGNVGWGKHSTAAIFEDTSESTGECMVS